MLVGGDGAGVVVRRAVAWLEAPLGRVSARRQLAVVASGHLGVILLLRATLGLSLRTSDDAEMMAAVSGYDGGSPRPELLFTNVLIGHALRALYRMAPELPWYGIYLHGLQMLAVSVIVVGLLVLLEGQPRLLSIASIGAVTLLVPGFVVAVQFTIVAFLLALAGPALFLALRARAVGAVISGLAGGAVMALGLLVRFQSFAAVAAVVALLILVISATTGRFDARGIAVLTATVAILGLGAVTLEAWWWGDRLGIARPQAYITSQLADSFDPASGEAAWPVAEVRAPAGSWSRNDRMLAGNWMLYPEMIAYAPVGPDGPLLPATGAPFLTEPVPLVGIGAAPTASPPAGSGNPLVAAVRGLVQPVVERPLEFLRGVREGLTTPPWPFGLALAVPLMVTGVRRRVAALAFIGGFAGLLGAIGATRLPDRVALPMLLTLVIGSVLVVGPARRASAGGGLGPTAAVAVAAILLLGVIEQSRSTVTLADEATWRGERAERFFAELGASVDDDDTVLLWLVDTWWVMDPLGRDQGGRYRDRTIQLAGWQFLIPYRIDQREELGITDWIGAVADRDDVLLVASSERIELLTTLLRERRGRLCTEPDIVGPVRDGRDLLLQRIDDVPCYGAPIDR